MRGATVVASTPAPAVPAPATPTPTPTPAPAPTTATPAPASAPTTTTTTPVKAAPAPTPTAPVAVPLPTVKHVFLIMLSDNGLDAAFGPGSAAPLPGHDAPGPGRASPQLLRRGPERAGQRGRPDQRPGSDPADRGRLPAIRRPHAGTPGSDGQATGTGCVYPTQSKTLPDELAAGGQVWRAYVEDIGNGGPASRRRAAIRRWGPPTRRRRPARGRLRDLAQPVRLFPQRHRRSDVRGQRRRPRQARPRSGLASTAPTFAYIVPNRCHDGSAPQPCAPGQPAGLAAADAFLRTVVPEIIGSAAYKDGGLIAITFDQAPQAGPGADSSSCCLNPTYPNLPAGVPPATTTVPYALPAPTAPGTQTAPAAPAPAAATTTPAPDPAPTTTTPAVSPPAAAPATSFPVPKNAKSTGGGGRVGLLLISPFVKPGSVDQTAYNHFSLLASVQDLLTLPNIGYAGLAGLPVFDAAVYNAGTH